MIEQNEFAVEIRRLHVNAGSGMSEKAMMEKIGGWFDLWGKFYADTGKEILVQMVDLASRQFERMPSFGQFVGLRPQILGTAGRSTEGGRTICTVCIGRGMFSARKAGYIFAFRCHACENWKGRFDGFPKWESALLESGYVHVQGGDGYDSGDEKQVRGAAIIMDAAPKVYSKVLERQPDMTAAVDDLAEREPG